ncbi:Retrovirus-related Pol polyprotein from transposon 412 [Araneus ventricosus]|uniref:RNA-directed DNA polymerase n=1 Tax=Araneus ventricosus TaxID=182803 RepID=A0A4Y2RXS0_ARAVE|nr:Retrovirus-related Pol polyprotein from transposon 412 [Araneus ventricosus]GBN80652.1 Retrovirus-related Pol polyprotein from transposon 412 [Araneus ventricosus]
MAYELGNYFKEWITGLGVQTFEQLIGLMVTDQIKRRVPADIQDHFIDEWSNIISANELCKNLDAYEEVLGKSVLRKKYGKRTKAGLRTKTTSEMKAEYGNKWRSQGLSQSIHRRMDRAEEVLERRRKPQCYECGSFQHLRPQCPKLKKKTEPLERVNHVGSVKEDEFLLPFTSTGLVNGVKMPILRDTSASIHIICRKYITPEMLTGEHVWVQQPLDVASICLPLAEIELSCDRGHIITKTTVVREELDQGRYLLGNWTACLFEDKTNMVCHLNAVQTRRQRQLKEQSKTPEPEAQLEIVHDKKSDEDLLLESRASFPPPAIVEDAALSLIKVDSVTFGPSQRSCPDLQPLFAKAREAPSNSKENFVLEKDLLFKKGCDKVGQERLLLIVLVEFRENIKTMIHEGTSAHLGITKTKDRLNRYFFWPNCYKDVENFVRLCDSCQRAGRPGDKKKATLKIVPIISEVFSKINVDACGPLPITFSGNKYIITAMCLSSKYPDAIAVPNIESASVVDALLQIFSRTGFSKELQCDQGKSFISTLTTESLERFGVKVTHSSVYHLQSNPIERFHRTLKRILRVLCFEEAPDWEKCIHPAFVCPTYRNSREHRF